jgi:DNA-binding transcriptional ArsR family regulator
MTRNRTIELTDPRALRGIAHPIRLSLIALLRREGPLTATRAGELLGESPASCSFHLRQLAKYGLVEEAGGGRGRERPWRATAAFTHLPPVATTPEVAAASELLFSVIAERYFEHVLRWVERRSEEPPEWQEASVFGDAMLYLTVDELEGLGEAWWALLEPYLERTEDAALRPPDARLVNFFAQAFPAPPERDRGKPA